MFSLLEIWGHLYLRTGSWFCVGKTWILGLLTPCQRSQKSNSITFDFSDSSYTECFFFKVNSHLVQDLNNYIFYNYVSGIHWKVNLFNTQCKKWAIKEVRFFSFPLWFRKVGKNTLNTSFNCPESTNCPDLPGTEWVWGKWQTFQNLPPGLSLFTYQWILPLQPPVDLGKEVEKKWPFSPPLHSWYLIGLALTSHQEQAIEFLPERAGGDNILSFNQFVDQHPSDYLISSHYE